jgi:hypothetical protein
VANAVCLEGGDSVLPQVVLAPQEEGRFAAQRRLSETGTAKLSSDTTDAGAAGTLSEARKSTQSPAVALWEA